MISTLRATLLGLVLFIPLVPLVGQQPVKRVDHGKVDGKLKGFSTPEGFKLELVPVPKLVSPVGLAFTADNVLVVREAGGIDDTVKKGALTLTYKDGSTRKIDLRTRTGKDAIHRLAETRGKDARETVGRAEHSAGVAALAARDGWDYEASPGVVRRKGEKGEEIVVRGFGDVPQGVTGLAFGPDGWLYISVGAGNHYLEGSDGGKVTLLGTGGVFRCRADGAKLHLVARGFQSPTAPTWDSVGQAFLADRDSRSGRVLHLLDGNDHGYRLPTRLSPVAEEVRKEVFEALPGNAPTMLRTVGSAPSAVLAPIEAHLPGHYRALLFVADPGRHAIQALALDPEGATFSVGKAFDVLASDDKEFLPVDLAVGPDGALYVLDGRGDGRLLRLTWAGVDPSDALPRRAGDSWSKLLKSSDEDLLAALSTPEASDRRIAGEELARRGAKHLPALLKLVEDREQPLLARLAALSATLGLWGDEARKLCLTLLGSTDQDLRRLAAEALGLNSTARDEGVHAGLLKAFNDGDPTVRRAVAIAIGRLHADDAADALVSALIFDENRDPAFRVALHHAIELLGKPGMERLLRVGDSGVDAEIAKIATAFMGLSSPAAAEALPKLLLNPHLYPKQRVQLLRTYPRYRFDPPVGLDAIAAHFEAMPDEPSAVKLAALEALALSNSPANTAKLGTLLKAWLDDKDTNVRVAALHCVPFIRPAAADEVLGARLADADRSLAERAAALRALASLEPAGAQKAFTALAADVRTKLLAELKKLPDAADLLRTLEK